VGKFVRPGGPEQRANNRPGDSVVGAEERETQMKTDDTCDITIGMAPPPLGHPLTHEVAEKQFTAIALARGADAVAFGTAGNGDWTFKAYFEDADCALAFAVYFRSINPAMCTVDCRVKDGGPVN
jgi:hypothetical protein